MKSRILYLIIYVCLLPLAGCNVHEWPDKRETVSFLLQLNFHPAMGEMDYFYTRGSSRAVAGHDMRYVVRAFPLNADGSTAVDYTEEFIFTRAMALGDDYNYSTRLELPEGNYRLSVWADFVDAGTTAHKYYDYDDFAAIVLHGEHKANTDYRDAFSGTEDVTLLSSIYEDAEVVEAVVEMTRPLAKYTFPGSKVMSELIVYALMFSSAVTAIPNYLIMTYLGLVDTYWAVILTAIGGTLGLYLMKNFIGQIPDSLLEAATIDGANEFTIYWKIIMPLCKPAWITLIILSFQQMWGTTGGVFIYSEELKPVSYVLSQLVSGGIARTGVSSAVSLIMMLVPVAVFVISQSNVIETMSTSGMKD